MSDERERRGGRPWGPLRDGPEAVRDLAGWLRRRVEESGQPLRTLSGAMPYGKDTISRHLNGRALPPWGFVTSLIAACYPRDQRAQAKLLATANGLWQDAEQSGRAPERVAIEERPGDVVPLVRELVAAVRQAEEHRDQARRSRELCQGVISGLMFFLGRLTGAVDQLRSERDVLRAEVAAEQTARRELAGRPGELTDLDRRLTASEHTRQRAEGRLSEARTQLVRAEDLHERAVTELRRARRRLAAVERADGVTEVEENARPAAPDEQKGDLMGMADQQVADAVLDRAQNLLDDSSGQLDRLERTLDEQADWDQPNNNRPADLRHLSVTPSPRLLMNLVDSTWAPWQCIAALIDSHLPGLPTQLTAAQRSMVTITVPTTPSQANSAQIRVRSAGMGMDAMTLQQALHAWARPPSKVGSPNAFGLAFLVAATQLGSKITIRTTRAGDKVWVAVNLDLQDLARDGGMRLLFQEESKDDSNECGTETVISGLRNLSTERLSRSSHLIRLKEQLGDVYRYLLNKGILEIFVNRTKVQHKRPCIWDSRRVVIRSGEEIFAVQKIDHPLVSRRVCDRCGYLNPRQAETCDECGGAGISDYSRRIWGWLGVQRYLDRVDFGIDFLYGGRKVLIRDKRMFTWADPDELGEPELEYPVELGYGRIVGEIHCDHLSVNLAKSAFDYESNDWKLVTRTIRGDGPLRPMIAQKSGYAVNRSPLGLLFNGFRRADPGLNYLVPGDGASGLNELSREWARKFHSGDSEYQSDQIWYNAAVEHDRKRLE